MKPKQETLGGVSFDGRFAGYAAAALAAASGVAGFEGTAEGAVIYSGIRNIAVDPTNNTGIYIDFETNSASTSGVTTPLWDFNLFSDRYVKIDPTPGNSNSGDEVFGRALASGHPNDFNREVGPPDDLLASKLDVNVTIGPASTFALPQQTDTNAATGLFRTILAYQQIENQAPGEELLSYGDWDGGPTTGFLGVRFANALGQTNYGWIRLTAGPGPTYPFTVIDWAYENTGAAITTPIPEPAAAGAALGALALGAVRRPRKR